MFGCNSFAILMLICGSFWGGFVVDGLKQLILSRFPFYFCCANEAFRIPFEC